MSKEKSLDSIIKEDKKISRRGFLKTSMAAGMVSGAAIIGGGGLSSFIAGCTTKEQFDTIIANGVIYCGDGKAPINGSIGIRDGKIAATDYVSIKNHIMDVKKLTEFGVIRTIKNSYKSKGAYVKK